MTRDWRESAYLRKENWPEAIPWTGPKREYGPYPWSPPDDPTDNYPHTHPDAGSVGDTFLGDVCPWCGVPLRWDETVVLKESGEKDVFHELNDLDSPKPAYHPDCWHERRAELNVGLSEYTKVEA